MSEEDIRNFFRAHLACSGVAVECERGVELMGAPLEFDLNDESCGTLE